MNSYFEQSGFYGHPHQTAAGMMSSAASHHDQASAAAAYRGFPLSLGSAAETNGYKDVWNATTGASAAQTTGSSVPVRPSACTPDSRVSGYIDAAASSPASRTGSTVGSGTAAWNANCGIGAPSAQSATSGLHQSNHTFYPWMAIAGKRYSESLAGSLLPDWIGKLLFIIIYYYLFYIFTFTMIYLLKKIFIILNNIDLDFFKKYILLSPLFFAIKNLSLI
uniref:CSON005903 protein n=1 Tax=Culicoides sonorensis TaxID=179676 RepID=A0A336L8B0_CULSO